MTRLYYKQILLKSFVVVSIVVVLSYNVAFSSPAVSKKNTKQINILEHLLSLQEKKSRYKSTSFPFVDKNIFKEYWKNNSFNNPYATPFAVKTLSFLKKNINTVDKFLNKYKSFTAAYQLKSDGSPTGDGRNDDCITVNEFIKQSSLKDRNNDLIKDNQEVNTNEYPSITIPYLTTISPEYHIKKKKR